MEERVVVEETVEALMEVPVLLSLVPVSPVTEVSVVEVRVSVTPLPDDVRRRPSTSPGVDASCTPPPQEQHASWAGGASVPATRDAKVLLPAVHPGPCPPLDVQRRFRL